MNHFAEVLITFQPEDRPAVETLYPLLETWAPVRRFVPDSAGGIDPVRKTAGGDARARRDNVPMSDVYAGALSNADVAQLIANVERLPWGQPELVQLFVRAYGQAYFRVWMFHGAMLRQLVPEGRDEEARPSEGPSDIRIRFALATDSAFLREMLVAAVDWKPGRDIARERVLRDPHITHYLEGWPQVGDFGLIAEGTRGASGWQPVPVGAAWLRFFTEDDPGYGFVAGCVPELTIGVRSTERGRGIGTALIRSLLRAAGKDDIDRVSLSVERNNPARRIYAREGVRVHDLREGEDSLTMIATLRPAR